MHDMERYLRRCSKRLSRSVKSIQVYDRGCLRAVILNQNRYFSAVYSQKVNARRRVYRKTYNALVLKTIQISLPEKITDEEISNFLGNKGNFKPILFEKTSYGKVSVCISPSTFRLFRKTAAIKMSFNNVNSYINGLPVYRRDGKLKISGALREI